MYNCAMHPHYISDKPGNCPICGMALTPMDKGTDAGAADQAPGAPAGNAESSTGVRIDPAIIQNMGVRTETVMKRELTPEIRASGKVRVDETRQFTVTARVMGWVEKLMVASTGEAVRKGQPLMELYSPELLSTQEEHLQALRYAGSLEGSAGGTEEARRAAGELLESSRRRLLNWDVPASRIRDLEKRGVAERTLPVLAPASGVILEKSVVQGQNVMPGMPLYRLADLSRVWVVASVYQGDVARVKVGSPAEITLSYLPGKAFLGKVAFVSPVLDPVTRTAEVRIEAANTPGLDLKPEMFATVVLRPPSAGPVVAVPEQAIIRSGRRDLAIIGLGGGYFEPRAVTLGRSAGGYVEILAGLREGETLVVSSQFLIDSESNLKAAIRQMQARWEGSAGKPGADTSAGPAASGPMGNPGPGPTGGRP